MRKWLRKLWNGFKPVNQSSAEKERTEPFSQRSLAEPYMSKWYFGHDSFKAVGDFVAKYLTYKPSEERPKPKKEERSVYFINDSLGIRKMIIDEEGRIQNFPGIEKEEFWTREVENFRESDDAGWGGRFERRGGAIIMIWEFQRDARYYASEYGSFANPKLGIMLYSTLDEKGDFLHPFRIYELQTDSGTAKNYYRPLMAKLHFVEEDEKGGKPNAGSKFVLWEYEDGRFRYPQETNKRFAYPGAFTAAGKQYSSWEELCAGEYKELKRGKYWYGEFTCRDIYGREIFGKKSEVPQRYSFDDLEWLGNKRYERDFYILQEDSLCSVSQADYAGNILVYEDRETVSDSYEDILLKIKKGME